MTDHLEQIQQLYADAKSRRDKAWREYERADIELKVYEKVLGLAQDLAEKPLEKTAQKPVAKKRNRGLSDKWVSVFSKLVSYQAGPYSYDDILEAGQMAGDSLNRAGLRTQMGNMVNRGAFTRLDGGLFEITPLGRKLIGLPENEEASEHSEAPASVGLHGGEEVFPAATPEGSSPSSSTAQSVEKPSFFD